MRIRTISSVFYLKQTKTPNLTCTSFSSSLGFPLALGLGNSLLCRPVHGGMFSSILGLYPRESTLSPAPSCDNENCLQTWPNVPRGATLPPAADHCSHGCPRSFLLHNHPFSWFCLFSWAPFPHCPIIPESILCFVPMSVMKWFLFRWTIASIPLNRITFQSFSYLISQLISIPTLKWSPLLVFLTQIFLGLIREVWDSKECWGFPLRVDLPSSRVLARALSNGGKRVLHTKREQASQSKPFSSFCLKHIC